MTSLPPLVPVREPLPPGERRRAARHLLLDGFGPEAQARLAGARVVVIGAGGLGSPVLQYLAAAGVGTLGIVDDDVVAPSNLQRQVLHGVDDAGRPKTTSATDTLRALRGPGLKLAEHRLRLDAANARELLAGYDLVVDGSDTFATRYTVSAAAAALGMPVVWGTVLGWDGQVAVWWSAAPDGRALTYPDVFGPQPPEGESCETVGVLGPACGAVGSAMAVEAVKLLTGTGDVALGRILVYDARTSAWDTIPLTSPGPPPASGDGHGTRAARPVGVDDSGRPGSDIPRRDPRTVVVPRSDATDGGAGTDGDLAVRLPDGALVVDVGRLPARLPAGTPAVRAELEALAAGDLPPALADHPPDAPVVVVCERGLRSRGAAALLADLGWSDVTPAGHLLFT
ncbi:HesA/MoeB/ThiF family protein [Myceligenerans pegani]|uniref:HesA/MoeB/ThiF family protein n=1 Tax=Myceligenerans pegani TaxID=2776917 RepID=A0ABR9MYS4_9MICO|nr:HesA/MoeB/ThiF family protein [Myceligenerans sp. TRM 65318]MBE1876008.1 HesA/MoeB/ThiF family protein [Myceligenerans sp. TRM 65318]MBE3018279.1 HesA/MoeB/ThiF family protein [Myceligenerans sp. TRM 65318]